MPMIVVMPHGHAIQSASVGPFKAVQQPGPENLLNFTAFTKELLQQIIPTIEENFRVYSDADHRAIGGLSMGAFQSVQIAGLYVFIPVWREIGQKLANGFSCISGASWPSSGFTCRSGGLFNGIANPCNSVAGMGMMLNGLWRQKPCI